MTKQYLLKKDKEDARDYIYKSVAPTPAALPASVDLRPKMSPIVDQLSLGSCTSNAAVSGFREYMLISGGLPLIKLSRLYHYYKEREIEGTINSDSGAFLRDAFVVLNQNGVCPEPDFPYDISTFTNAPTVQAEQEAPTFKIDEYHRVPDFAMLQQALADGFPVVIGISVYDSFESYNTNLTGYVTVPDTTKERFLGGHALCACGYETINGVLYIIVRNSWGTNYGDHGYYRFPKAFFDGGFVFDMWTGSLKPVYESILFPQATAILVQKKVIESPDFWTNLYNKYLNLPDSDFRYVGLLMQKMGAYASFLDYQVKDQNAYKSITFQQALDIIVSKNIINSPVFWTNLCTKYDSDSTSDFVYVSLLIRKFAVLVQGL